VIAYGADGIASHVRVVSAATGEERMSFFAYAPGFVGGVRVALGDVNNDGTFDVITGTGPGAGPHVKVFDGRTGRELYSFFAYAPTFAGGLTVSSGDVNADGFADIITGVGAGAGPHVKVFDGRTGQEISSFFAFAPGFIGGVTVAGGDVNNDGFVDVIVGSASGPGHVKVFDGRTFAEIQSFFSFDPGYVGGVTVGAGDYNGDGFVDVVVGAAINSSHVKVFAGSTSATLASFFAFPNDPLTNGVNVGFADSDRDGVSELVVGQHFGGRARRFNPFSGELVFDEQAYGAINLGIFVG
jgi:hypothetical protein